MLQSDTVSFLRAWLGAPLRVAAPVPSSSALAKLMTNDLTPATGPVIELGPGTGVFTRALVARGIDERDLTLIEYRADFADLIRARFPRARVLHLDAAGLYNAALFPSPIAGAVISGLPLLSMPMEKVIAIVGGAFSYLTQHGAFYQFTYFPFCPISRNVLDRLGLRATRISSTLFNIPPAAVYRIVRRDPPQLMHA